MGSHARALLGTCAGLLLLCGCAGKVHRVALDPARLVGQPQAKLMCPYRVGEVVDARPSQGRAGGLSEHLFLVEDAAALMRDKLVAGGLSGDAGTQVDARLLHLYMAQNLGTKVPVVVLEVKVGQDAPLVLRAQKASMNWNGSEDEAYKGFSQIFDDLMAQLVKKLNGRCATAG